MSVTRRFIIIASIGLILLIITPIPTINNLIFIAYNLLCIALLAADYIISPKLAHFTIKRDIKRSLVFNAENTISVFVTSTYKKPVSLSLRDDFPYAHFPVGSEDMSALVMPNETALFSYNVTPMKRGNFTFGKMYLKYSGVLGLCNKYKSIDLTAEYKVYPNVQRIREYISPATSACHGMSANRFFRGSDASHEFDSLREYKRADNYKNINWPATSRTGKPITNIYEDEKNKPVYILLDTGRNMNYMLNKNSRLDYAINESLLLAHMANKSGNDSGLIVFNTEITAYIKPGRSQIHRNRLVNALYAAQPCNRTSNYSAAFNRISRYGKGFIFIFTDFETDIEALDLIAQIKHSGILSRHIPVIGLIKSAAINDMLRSENIYERHVALEYTDNRNKIIKHIRKSGISCIEYEPLFNAH